MSNSRTCKHCSHVFPADFSDPTCPVCGAVQQKLETPQQDLTAATREERFSLGAADEATAAHKPATPIPSTVPGDRRPAPKFTPRVPPDLPNYSGVTWINHGGMGDVYRAVQAGTGRAVAIKVMRSSVAAFHQNLERFENEARALARVDHPGVVRVYEYGECPAGPYFSMEFVAGVTLAQRIKERGPLPPGEAAGLVRAAADAVHAAHRVGVLHRDLKPSNIMLADDGTVKVTDFGLAKHDDDAEDLTATGVIVGTPSYMAPEQANAGGKSALTPTADVYGLGGTLYHLLTGRPPHKGDSKLQSVRKAATEVVDPPRAHRPDLCPVLDAIVQKSLAYDPRERYPSAAAFADDLANWAAKKPTRAVPATRWDRVRRWAYRRPAAVAAAVLLPLLVGAAVVASREADPRYRLERDLSRPGPTALIGPTGNPRWTSWLLNPVEPALTYDDGEVFSFQTQSTSILLLTPKVPHDRYELTLELKHLKASDPVAAVGVYIGSGAPGGPPDVYRGLSFEFRDHPLLFPTGTPPQTTETLVANDRVTVSNAVLTRSTQTGIGQAYDFPLVNPVLPGQKQPPPPPPYRKMKVEASPEAVVAYWDVPGKGYERAYTIPAADLNRDTPRAAANMAQYLPPGFPLAVPPWAPGGPIGVVVTNSTVAIRNVVYTPVVK